MKFSDTELLDFINKNKKTYEQEKNNLIKCTNTTCTNCDTIDDRYFLHYIIAYITKCKEQNQIQTSYTNITLKDRIFSLTYNCARRRESDVPEQLYCKLDIPIQKQLSLFIKEICEIT